MARKKRGRPKKKKLAVNTEETSIVFAIIFMMAAGISLVSLFVDAPYFVYIHKYLGWGIPAAVIFFGFLSLRLFGYKSKFTAGRVLIGQFLFFLAFDAFLHSFLPVNEALQLAEKGNYGGMVGYWASDFLIDRISRLGALVFLSPILIISLSMGSGLSLVQIRDFIMKISSFITNIFNSIMQKFGEKDVSVEEKNAAAVGENSKRMVGELSGKTVVKVKDHPKAPALSTDLDITPVVKAMDDYSNWKYPPINLLNPPLPVEDTRDDMGRNANIIEQTLDSFGVQARVSDISSGPTVTQYALDIAMGTKVSRIKNLAGDLALALAAPSGAVRIEAPIPGTSLVGVEVPNLKPKLVTIREVMESSEMNNKKLKLGLAVGKNVSGKVMATDLQKMPHMLIAGSTGSGKSITINAFLLSLLMKMSPSELRLILVDPKMVELSLYNGLPHLLTPVITEMDKVVNSLKWALVEMQRRYTLFKQARVRNMQEYNEIEGEEHLPYVVIVVDEMADLMMTAGNEVESCICRLAQMARATGIHLVLATQRPSVDVLTGLIKANIPARIGMSVATTVDSRVILDQIGAETLLGNGDMLYRAPDKNRLFRIQGAFVENAEIERVVSFIKEQAGGEVEYEETVVQSQDKDGNVGSSYSGGDELFDDAVRIVCAAGKASSSMLQRKMRIGYNRAARLIDELEEAGVVGQENGPKPRDVLIADAERFLSGGAEDSDVIEE